MRGIATIDINQAAWIAAAAASGCAVLGSAALWPLMKRMLRNYDAAQNSLPSKDAQGAAAAAVDVEEDAFQKAIERKLAPVEVDPNDKSVKAYFNRFR